MFNENYDSFACASTIKKFAKVIAVIGIVLMILAALAGIILCAIDDDLILIGVIVLVGGFILGFSAMIGAHCMWGFGDIVANTKIAASGASAVGSTVATAIDPEELPEL